MTLLIEMFRTHSTSSQHYTETIHVSQWEGLGVASLNTATCDTYVTTSTQHNKVLCCNRHCCRGNPVSQVTRLKASSKVPVRNKLSHLMR